MSAESWKLENDLCRCCHAEGSFKSLGEPYYSLGQTEVFTEMLRHCFDIDMNPVEGAYSSTTFTICEVCIVRLRDASNFKHQVLMCEERFKDMYRNVKDVIEIQVKQESPSPSEDGLKEEDAAMSEDGGFDLRFDDDDDEKTVLEIKIEDAKKAKGKGKAKPKPAAKAKKAVAKKVSRPKPKSSKPKAADSKAEDETKPKKDDGLPFMLTTADDGTDDYNCKTCGKIFKKRALFTQHYNHVHLKRRPKLRGCHMCGTKVYPYMRAAHMESAHGVPAPKCNACNKKFSYPFQVIAHQKSYHMGEKDIPCPYCDVRFSKRTHLRKHLPKHSSLRMYECSLCEKAFKWKKNLETHTHMHLDYRRHVCLVCSEAFVQQSSLSYHMKKRHPELD